MTESDCASGVAKKGSAEARVARVGLFWGLPMDGHLELVSFSRPASAVASVGGFRTLEEGHVELWPQVIRRRSWLAGIDYARFPRGRVNQILETGRFIILSDVHLLTAVALPRLLRRFGLNAAITDVSADPHYRSPDW